MARLNRSKGSTSSSVITRPDSGMPDSGMEVLSSPRIWLRELPVLDLDHERQQVAHVHVVDPQRRMVFHGGVDQLHPWVTLSIRGGAVADSVKLVERANRNAEVIHA